ncbi:MAG: virulence RhuM family protein [Elusimicrobiales bacterium]|nr:virulence RhuM family protein [Elusimicrobiales bacterium]
MDKTENRGEIVIYTSKDGKVSLDARLENDTIWLTQDMIVRLFESSKANVSEHIKHIFEEEELEQSSTVRKFRTVRKEGNRQVSRELEFYNLDLILSVGYRIKSKTATQFRKWATSVLRDYITKGYAVNEARLKEQQKQISALKKAISLVERSLTNQAGTLEEAKNIAKLLEGFSAGLDLLDDYDHKTLDKKGLTQKKVAVIEEKEFLSVIDQMKSEFTSDVFAMPKDSSFSSSVRQIYQSFGGQELYPSLEEKAAMLLYMIVKNHSFADGNKRIGASCFLYFLDKNGILYRDGSPVIDNKTLFAITLLIAESKPEEMETMRQIALSVLNRKNG